MSSAVRFVFDLAVSRFTARTFAGGMLSALGHNPTFAIRDFGGDVIFAADSSAESSLRVRIRAASLELTDKVSDKDRKEIERAMNQEVLETAEYPEIVFESTTVSAGSSGLGGYSANITGNLTLHGVTQNLSLMAQFSITGDTMQAHGEFPVLLSAFRIKPVSVAGGALKLKDEVKLAFNLVARKQEAS